MHSISCLKQNKIKFLSCNFPKKYIILLMIKRSQSLPFFFTASPAPLKKWQLLPAPASQAWERIDQFLPMHLKIVFIVMKIYFVENHVVKFNIIEFLFCFFVYFYHFSSLTQNNLLMCANQPNCAF